MQAKHRYFSNYNNFHHLPVILAFFHHENSLIRQFHAKANFSFPLCQNILPEKSGFPLKVFSICYQVLNFLMESKLVFTTKGSSWVSVYEEPTKRDTCECHNKLSHKAFYD